MVRDKHHKGWKLSMNDQYRKLKLCNANAYARSCHVGLKSFRALTQGLAVTGHGTSVQNFK